MEEKNIKLICLDIDGTLLNKDRDISKETQETFKRLNKNYHTVLASSRMPSAMYYLQEKLDLKDRPLIAYNGALILGNKAHVVESIPMQLDFLQEIINHQKNYDYNISTFCNDTWRTAAMDQWTKHEMHTTRCTPELVPNEELIDLLQKKQEQPHKIMCMGPEDVLDNLIVHLENTSQAQYVHFYRSKKTYLEIITEKSNKSAALSQLLKQHYTDITMDEVVAFGDNYNDIDLLKNAGWGIAVANAKEELKAVADHVSTYTNKEHAVAYELKDL